MQFRRVKTAPPAGSGKRRRDVELGRNHVRPLTIPSPSVQPALPGHAPHRPPPDSIDGQIAEIYRQLADGEIDEVEAARRDAALRRLQAREASR